MNTLYFKTMEKRIFFLLTLMALATVLSFGQSGKKYFTAGMEFDKNMRYEDAVTQFNNAIGLEPSNAGYYYARGRSYESLKKNTEAGKDFERALVFTPKDVDAMISLGRVYNKMGKFGEALNLLNRASELEKRNPLVYPEKVISLIGLKMYDRALRASDTAIIIKRNNAMNYYYRGVIYVKLNNEIFGRRELEKAISKDKRLIEPRLALAELLLPNDPEAALDQCDEVLKYNNRNTGAYVMRGKVYMKKGEYPKAINDASTSILIDPENPDLYLFRGTCYQEFTQHAFAISDFTKYISIKKDDPKGYFARAKSYTELGDDANIALAIEDYQKITELSRYDQEAREMLDITRSKLYDLNRENVPPSISILYPAPLNDTVELRGDNNSLRIIGEIKDKSKIKSLVINNVPVTVVEKDGAYSATVDMAGMNSITLIARDDYDNETTLKYPIKRTEIIPPRIKILSPLTTDNGQIYLPNNSPSQYIQGEIFDQSRIKSLKVDGAIANFRTDEINPEFSATVDIQNKAKILIEAEDIYGNRQVSEFTFNREGVTLAETNPMGKTWVVFVENSSYSSFVSLDGPGKDYDIIRGALAKYQIHSIIHKQNMTKEEMEKFFSIELRDLIRTNQVKSLLIWYAGHGKFINNVGYWIPIDAKIDDEYSYFNLNTLRASMETYLSYLTHTLVVTDACESGPTFYQAMRRPPKRRRCDSWEDTQFKSSQVFYSAGRELALDESQFTRTFANALTSNPNACLPIDDIVDKVTTAVSSNTRQTARFGTIAGLRDENGTFFFIAK